MSHSAIDKILNSDMKELWDKEYMIVGTEGAVMIHFQKKKKIVFLQQTPREE